MDNIIYQEQFERIIDKNRLKHLILELENTYTKQSGWEIGEIKQTVVDNERIRVSTQLVKKSYPNDGTYRETFTRVIDKNNLNLFLNSIYEGYTEDLGWTIGEPLINDLNDNEIIVRVPLTKTEPTRKTSM